MGASSKAFFALLIATSSAGVAMGVGLQPGQVVGEWTAPDSPVFARLGQAVLTQGDIDAYLIDRVPQEHQAGFLRDPNRIADLIEQQLLSRQLAAQAIDRGILEDKQAAAQLYDKTIRELAMLEIAHHIDTNRLDSYSTQAKELMLTEPGLVDNKQEKVTFDQMLVLAGDKNSRLEKAVRMADLYERYRKGVLDFDTLIKHSEDPSLKDNNGRYEEVDPAQLDEVVRKEIERLGPGDITEPFESRFGWHMIRLVSRDYSDIPEADRLARYEDIARDRHLASLRKNYLNTLINQPFEIAPNAVADLMARYGLEVDRDEEKKLEKQLTPDNSQPIAD